MIPPSLRAGLMRLAFAFVLPLLLLSAASASQAASLSHNRPALKSIARAYGFVSGQSLSLDLIAEAHPDLSAQVMRARLAFDSAFPDVEDRLEGELRAAFGDQGFAQLRRDMFDKLIDLLQKQPMTDAQAREFLAEVQRRAHGEDIDGEVLDYLLAATYAGDPAAEFADGFRQRFRTDGSGKARGLKLRLQLPRSWKAADGERPHIVRKWTSEGGNGTSILMLDIRDAAGYAPSKADIEQFIAGGGVRELAPQGGEVVEASAFTLETLPGYAAVLRTSAERAGLRMVSWMQMFQVFFRGKAVGVMCTSVGLTTEAAKVEQDFRRIQPLCRQVANSLVLEQLYE